MFEIDVDRVDERLAVEECADGDFDSGNTPLQLENFNLVGERFFVGLQHVDYVLAVVFFAHKEAALDVLRLATGFDDVAAGILLNVVNGVVEGRKFTVRNDADARVFQFFLAERAVVFQAIGVRRATDYFLAGRAQGFGFFALAERVVENEDVGPIGVLLPVF